jgi:hypothetical protein
LYTASYLEYLARRVKARLSFFVGHTIVPRRYFAVKSAVLSLLYLQTCSVIDEVPQILKIQIKRLDVYHDIPHTIPEGYTVQISFTRVLCEWFLQVAIP